MSDSLPHLTDRLYLTHTGAETDLIFRRGVDLPEFASFPLLETDAGRAVLSAVYADQMAAARGFDCVTILESPTWMANGARAEPLGYDKAQLQRANIAAVAFVADMAGAQTLISANLGPMADAYGPAAHQDPDIYHDYHAQQIGWFAQTAADMVSAYTVNHIPEAVGIIRAAQDLRLPVVMSFTVETNGYLPDGTPLAAAVAQVDQQTGAYAAYFMVNCAHPDHLPPDFTALERVRGLVANASRCSHADLDNATALDDGDPAELGAQLAALRARAPHLNVLGGCCGTDARHLRAIARAVLA
ncbi:homocysteine S-methyltransferase [Yoonia tamlensis]|uniref:Homocysteine S-methyltransferase n=1 Tax=Yoonia tamlensis TaxID=390270 RepID=A0A1I6G775_9RHOB|nr:homocysteine S-methyltransferase family protein [Yoonia tamlensis]SFR38053.1 homocysteine S-methyltransferase [Yoonia tamlensis]